MPKQVRLRRGTTAQHATFTGAEGEVTFDTTKKVLVLHDGVTAGGKPLDGYVRLAGSPVEYQTIETGLQFTGGIAEDERALIVDNDVWFKSRVYVGSGSSALTTFGPTTIGPTADWQCTGRTTLFRLTLSQATVTYSATTNLDFDGLSTQTITLAGNLTLTTSNLAAGKSLLVRLIGDASSRNLTFPGGWRFVGGAAPANLAANKVALLQLECFGPNDADVVARWWVEP